jgi:hypothetical protein
MTESKIQQFFRRENFEVETYLEKKKSTIYFINKNGTQYVCKYFVNPDRREAKKSLSKEIMSIDYLKNRMNDTVFFPDITYVDNDNLFFISKRIVGKTIYQLNGRQYLQDCDLDALHRGLFAWLYRYYSENDHENTPSIAEAPIPTEHLPGSWRSGAMEHHGR